MLSAGGIREKTFIFSVATLSLFLTACGSKVEDSVGTPISSAQLVERIRAGWPPVILDVRTNEEFGRGHLPSAINIPHNELAGRLEELPITKSDEIVVHCQSGRRAAIAEAILRENGYSNVRGLAGHWRVWESAGLPTE